jgi:SAGA-associated factor 11
MQHASVGAAAAAVATAAPAPAAGGAGLAADAVPALASALFLEALEEALLDVALEAHREARTSGLDYAPFRHAPAGAAGAYEAQRYFGPGGRPLDVFGSSHPPVADDPIVCANCGRSVLAGRYAPHLEKCFGKGRAASRGAALRIRNWASSLVGPRTAAADTAAAAAAAAWSAP